MIRSSFRIAEYIQGEDRSLLKTETYLYLFDAALMFLTMALFKVFHPRKVVSRDQRGVEGYLEQRGGWHYLLV
jgi:hypothetical protein